MITVDLSKWISLFRILNKNIRIYFWNQRYGKKENDVKETTLKKIFSRLNEEKQLIASLLSGTFKPDRKKNVPHIRGISEPAYTQSTWEKTTTWPRAGSFFLEFGDTLWYTNERLQKSDVFRRSAVGTTHIIQSGHMMVCWKSKSLTIPLL